MSYDLQCSNYDQCLFNLFCAGFQLSFHTYFSDSQPSLYMTDHNNAITGKTKSSQAHLRTNTHRRSLTGLFFKKYICIYR